jgi:ribosomal protein L21E
MRPIAVDDTVLIHDDKHPYYGDSGVVIAIEGESAQVKVETRGTTPRLHQPTVTVALLRLGMKEG